ncbi:MAG: choice-of-anchor J domain-containing protein, partial [Muribaculaceae bacterium]|nr:choice-of-anchor J domain-containing protein [Muribaculaceae bacterium]
DNYLVSPQIRLGGSFTFYVASRMSNYPAEKFSVMVSESGNDAAGYFTHTELTVTLDDNTWHEYTVDLSAYSGMGYVAIRHWDCNDQHLLYIDDVTIVEGQDPSTGSGEFEHGETCVVTAIPAADYYFMSWTEDGTVVSTSASYTFTVTGDRDLVANFTDELPSQTVTLTEGWNWVSLYVEVADPVAMLQMVETALGENGQVIKSSDTGTEYDEEWGWLGDLDEIGMTNEQMYKIQVSAPCTMNLEGTPANPATHPITIVPGWNWIGFPSAEAISLENAFAGFAQEGDKIRNSGAEIDYDPEWGWFGDFETLEPGQGYMYYSASSTSRTLVFPASAK